MHSILFYQNLVESLANLELKFNLTTDLMFFNQYNSGNVDRMIYLRENSIVSLTIDSLVKWLACLTADQ